jgi:hypothetical protein
LDKNATVCRFIFAKYNKGIDSPELDDMSYEIHYYPMWKYKTKKKQGKKIKVNGGVKHWEPSRKMWEWFLPKHGLTSPNDITIHGCRI